MNFDQEEVRTFVRENQQIILPLVIIALLLFVYIIVVLAAAHGTHGCQRDG